VAKRKPRPSGSRSRTPAIAPGPAGAEDVARLRRAGYRLQVITGPVDGDVRRQALEEEALWLKRLPSHVRKLRELFGGYDAFDVLSGVMLAHAANQSLPLTDQDFFLDSLAPLEYAALILIERASRRPETGQPQFELEETITEALPHLRALTVHAGTTLSGYWHGSARGGLAEIHERFIRRYIFVPVNETDEQARSLLHEMFSHAQVTSWMRDTLHFDADDAEQLIDAIIELISESDFDREVARWPEASGRGIGDRLAFSAAAIASRAGVDESVAASLCDLIANRFGQRARPWPALPTPIRHRPLLKDQRGSYFAPIPAMALRGLRHTLAAALNPRLPVSGPGDKTVYARYIQVRGALIEARATTPMRELLRPGFVATNLHFSVRRPGGTTLYGEIDGLVVVDRTAIVIQAKSNPTRIDVLADDADGFADALGAIVTESMRQHDDARAALCAQRDRARFWFGPGGPRAKAVDIPDLSHGEILSISVTLDDLSGCAPASWELRDAGLATPGPLPWLVGLTPLETMLSLLPFAAQLVQFLRRRSLLNDARNLDVMDEIDIFLEYLHDQLEGVYAVRDSDGQRVRVMPPERFHQLDEWLAAQRTGDTRVKPPRQKLHRGVRALLERLDRDRAPGWLDASVAILDVPRSLHQRVGSMATKAASSRSLSPHGLTYDSLAGERRALTLLGEPPGKRLDDHKTRDACVELARREGAIWLTALVVPTDRHRGLRVLCADDAVD
jgi:hypothetical protein